MHTFIGAWIAGFCLAAAPGPMAVLCVQRTLQRGLRSGLATGSGIALGDAVWTLIAALAWRHVCTMVATSWAERLAGLVLLLMAAHLWFSKPSLEAVSDRSREDFWSALAATLANPLTVASMAAVMASFGSGVAVVPFVAGLGLGSAGWWLLLSAAVARGRHLVGPRQALWLSRGTAVLLAVLGLRCLG